MANVTKHKFTSAKADGADATLVRPSNWNDEHAFAGGVNGDFLIRDTGQSDGANWTSTIAPAALTSVPSASLTGNIAVARLTNGTFTVVTDTDTGAQNNWVPGAGVSGNTLIEWSGASSMAATGLAGGASGLVAVIKNTGSQIATFAHNSGSSTAGNRFQNLVTSAATPISTGGWIVYQHDGTDWEMIGHEQGAYITPTFAAGDYTASAGSWTVDSGDVGMCKYKLSGKTLHFQMEINNTDVSSVASLRRVIPGGFSVAGVLTGQFQTRTVDAGAATAIGTTTIGAVSATTIAFFSTIGGNTYGVTSADNTTIQFAASFEVT